MAPDLPLFIGVAAVVIIVPGPDTALVTKNALLYGRAAGLGTVLGVVVGNSAWTVATALGLASLLQASATAFTVLKLIGAAYLIWLGVQALRAARRRFAPADEGAQRTTMGGRRGFRQGLLSNLGNPKIAAFYTSLVPQFVGSAHAGVAPFLLLGAVFVLMTLAWLCAYALAASKLSAQLRRPRVKATLDRVTGVVLIGLGLRLAVERR